MEKPAILAHKTSSFSAPPNSWIGLVHCFNKGAQAVECDVSFTYGIPVIWSGNQKEVSGGKTMPLNDIWNFLNAYPDIVVFFDVKFYNTGLNISSFNDAVGHFSRIKPDLIRQAIKNIVQVARRQNLAHRIGFTTFCGGIEMLKKIKEVEPRVHNNLITIFPWTGVERHFPYLNSLTIGWNHLNGWLWLLCAPLVRRFINKARRAGLKLYGGHVNQLKDIDWSLEMGFDGIWTDNVPWAFNEIENRFRNLAQKERKGEHKNGR